MSTTKTITLEAEPPKLVQALRSLGVPEAQIEALRAKMKGRGKKIIVVGAAAGVAALALLGSALVTNAVILAGVTLGGAVLIYHRLPDWLKAFIRRHSLIVDIAAAVVTYLLMGGAITGLIAGGLVGIGTSALFLLVQRTEETR